MIRDIQNTDIIFRDIGFKYVSEVIYSTKPLRNVNSNIQVTFIYNYDC